MLVDHLAEVPQFLVGVVFKVFSQKRVLQLLAVEVFRVLAQDRVQQRRPQFSALQLMRLTLRMRRFPLFRGSLQSARVVAHSSAELGAHSSSSTLSAQQIAPFDDGTTWVDVNNDVWAFLDTAHGSYWKNLATQHTLWHPPWQR